MSTLSRRAPIPVGPFALQKKIGEGGMGIVWQALHPATGVRAAVKVLKSEKAWEQRTLNLFQTEVRAVAALNHPGIVMILDQGTIPPSAEKASEGELVAGSPYLAMELATAGTLFDRVGELTWEELRTTILGVLDALAHAHARGVVHRDIKPSNIMEAGHTDLRPGPKLTDFGIAQLRLKASDQPLDDRNFCGSPSYISPEQFQAFHHDVGPWSDLYSLGCTCWAVSTGQTPYRAPRLAEMLERHVQGELPEFKPLFDVPAGFGDWLRGLIQPRIPRRFQRAADAAEALHRLDARAASPRTSIHLPDLDVEDLPTLDSSPVPHRLGQVGQGSLRAARAASSHSAATVPSDWRTASPTAPLKLLGASLSLFGLRRLPLIGRHAERDQLWRALLDVTRTGQSRAVILRGGAGHGKSCIARWLCERSEELGAAVTLQAVHGAIPAPPHGIGPMLSRLLRSVGFSREETLRRAERRLKQLDGRRHYLWHGLTELISPSDDPDNTQTGVRFTSPEERYVVASAYLEREASRRPLVLWMDDVQWGGDAIALASHLLDRNETNPLPSLLVLTVRDENLAEGSFEAQALAALAAHPNSAEIELGPLGTDETSVLVGELLRLESELAGEVVRRTQGNPLFAIQLVGDWVARGVLELSGEGLALRDGASASLPDDIHQVWTGRFDRVLAERPLGARAALELAAALGQFVDWGEWRAVCRHAGVVPPAALLGDLAAEGLVRSDPMGWAFVHGMARESLERSAQEAGRWVELNSACADQLAELGGRDTNERVGLLLVAANRDEEALGWLHRAALDRIAQGEYRSAASLMDTRDDILTRQAIDPTDRRRAVGWVTRAQLLRLEGHLDTARQQSERIVRLAEQQDWPQVQASALREYGSALLDRGSLREATVRLEAARQAYKSLEDDDGVAATCLTLGYALRDLGELETAVTAFARAIQIREAQEPPTGLADCLSGLAGVRIAQGDHEGAEDLLQRAVAQLEQTGQLLGLARAWLNLSSVYCAREKYDEAITLVERARELRERLGNPGHTADCCNQQGEVHRLRGDLQSAEECYQVAVHLYESIGSPWAFMPRINLALVRLDQGRTALAQHGLEAGWLEVKKAGRDGVALQIDAMLLPCYAEGGDWAAWDERMARVRGFEPGVTRVDSDSARCLDMAAKGARAAGQEQRALEAETLAAAHWKAQGRSLDG